MSNVRQLQSTSATTDAPQQIKHHYPAKKQHSPNREFWRNNHWKSQKRPKNRIPQFPKQQNLKEMWRLVIHIPLISEYWPNRWSIYAGHQKAIQKPSFLFNCQFGSSTGPVEKLTLQPHSLCLPQHTRGHNHASLSLRWLSLVSEGDVRVCSSW